MAGREIYDVAIWPVGDQYRALLGVASVKAEKVGFVIRPGERHLSERARELLASLEDDLILIEETWSWPGSELVRSSAPYMHHVYRSVSEVVSALASASGSFGDWVSPGLPEDLHFLRADNSVVLGSIGHEGFIWLEMSPAEAALFEGDLPQELRGTLRRREV
jgi:hypothetical protein